MQREDGRDMGDGFCVQILTIDGESQQKLAQQSFYIENISRGGFRFIAAIDLEIDNRLQVLLKFPDQSTQEVLGRICYCDPGAGAEGHAYGFSVIEGFYSLSLKSAVA